MNAPQSHRDTELENINRVTARIIGCAMEVHRVLGPGLLESIYERAMGVELDEAQMEHKLQVCIPALYKGRLLGQYRVDLIVQDLVLVEIKSVERPLFPFSSRSCSPTCASSTSVSGSSSTSTHASSLKE
jgi:GxxExxY protein